MSRFVNVEATDEITLGNGDKVQVRQSLMAAEDAVLTRNLMRWQFDASTMQARAEEGDWHLQRLRICEAYLTGWDFKDDAGKLVPFASESIKLLDGDTINEIATAIDGLQKRRKEDFAKNAKRR